MSSIPKTSVLRRLQHLRQEPWGGRTCHGEYQRIPRKKAQDEGERKEERSGPLGQKGIPEFHADESSGKSVHHPIKSRERFNEEIRAPWTAGEDFP